MESQKILQADVLDIIFDGKNKSYGAYDLRKKYSKSLLMALGFTFGAALSISVISYAINRTNIIVDPYKDYPTHDFGDPKKPVKPKLNETPTVNRPKPLVTKPVPTVVFVRPQMVDRSQVDKPPSETNSDVEKSNITTSGGNPENGGLPQLPPNVGDGGGQPGGGDPPIVKPQEKPVVDLSNKTKQPDAWRPFLIKYLTPIVNEAAMDGSCEPGKYIVVVQFIVDENGNPSNPEVVEGGTSCGFGAKAMEAIRKGPKWPIARDADGNPLKSIQRTPIVFVIADPES